MFATMMLGNGTTRKYQFDNWGQLTTQIEFSGATPVCTIVDGYDPVGNRLTRNLDGNPITWSYDDLYRLTGQQKAGQVCTYTLDGVGNLKTMWEGGNFPRTFTFNAADRLVTMVEGANLTTYTWTGYGALSSEITGTATTNYGYNGQDQLALVTPPGDGFPTTYAFDGDGLRRSIQTTNVNQDPPTLDITTVVWDGSDYLLLNGPSSDAVVLTLGGEIVSSGSFDLLPDSLGSVIGDIRSGQDPRVPFSYWPYGTMLLSVVQPSFPFLFVGSLGYYYDSSDRDYVRARELMKKLGRWMQTDPLWPGETAYGYVGQSPMMFADGSGLLTIVNCDDSFEDKIKRLCARLSEMTPEQAGFVAKCIANTSKASNQTCQPFNKDRIACLKKFCSDGYVECQPTKPGGSYYGVCPKYEGPTDAPGNPVGGVIIKFPPGASNFSNLSGGGKGIWSGRLTFLHEIAHACGVDHGKYGHASDCQCNDIYACCLFEVLMGRDGSYCEKAMKEHLKGGKPC